MDASATAQDDERIVEGLRERKKRERRELIARTAMRLFDEKGYAATTIAEIAREADVSTRTVSLYFPAKEDLVFADSETMLDRLQAELATRQEGETFADGMRRWLTAQLAEWKGQEEAMGVRSRMVSCEPSLEAVELRNRARIHDLIADAIADDFSMDRDGLEAQMVAAATIAIFDVIGNRLKTGNDGVKLADDGILELFDHALVFVRAGMDALAKR